MLEFGQTIKAKREQKALTQKQLGQLLYVSDKTVSRWENNQIYPDITMLLDISKVLEIDYQELIEGSDYIEKKKAKQEQQIKQRKKGLICFIVAMFCILLVSTYLVYKNKEIKEIGVDYIVSKQWVEIGMTDSVERHIFFTRHFLTDYEKDRIIEYLDVDHWIKIEKLPEDAIHADYQLAFYTPSSNKGNNYITYQKNETYYFVLHEDPTIVYQLPINPTNFSVFFRTLPISDISYNHLYENKSSYTPLTDDEWIEPRTVIEDYDENIISFYDLGIGTKYYFIIITSKFDIQTLDIKDDVMYITGEKRLYTKPYAIGFKVNESLYINQVYVNGELKYDPEKLIFSFKE